MSTARDDLARERLCRYLARPAFSLARLGVRRDGLVVYRVMSPVECLARLAAMVPPPRSSSSKKRKSTSSVAAARAKPGAAAAVVSRIERPGLGPSA